MSSGTSSISASPVTPATTSSPIPSDTSASNSPDPYQTSRTIGMSSLSNTITSIPSQPPTVVPGDPTVPSLGQTTTTTSTSESPPPTTDTTLRTDATTTTSPTSIITTTTSPAGGINTANGAGDPGVTSSTVTPVDTPTPTTPTSTPLIVTPPTTSPSPNTVNVVSSPMAGSISTTSSIPSTISSTGAASTASALPDSLTSVSTSIYLTTSDGQLVTVTALITRLVAPDPTAVGIQSSATSKNLNNDGTGSSHSFFSNTGAVAGTFTVIGLLVAGLVIGAAVLLARRKRTRRLNDDLREAAGGAGDGGAGVDRFGDEEEDNPFSDVGPLHRHGSSHSYHTTTFRPIAFDDDESIGNRAVYHATNRGSGQFSDAYGGTMAGIGIDPYGEYRLQHEADMAEIRSASVLGSPLPQGYNEWTRAEGSGGSNSNSNSVEAEEGDRGHRPASSDYNHNRDSNSSFYHDPSARVPPMMPTLPTSNELYDHRLQHANQSESSLADERDYSRRLRVANADITASNDELPIR